MQLEEHADASAFLDTAAPVLDIDEPRHNLIYGICSTLIGAPDVYREKHFWTVHDGDVVGAAMMTPPFNLIVAKPPSAEALPFLARRLSGAGVTVPGVTGALPEADVFAEAWSGSPRLRMSQGIYAARKVQLPQAVKGEARSAGLEDHGLIVEWLLAFSDEAIAHDSPHMDHDAAVERRLRSEEAGFALWIVESEPVSICGYGGRTPRGTRIGPVYTPPDLRGHGYGSAVTAYVTKEQLDGGLDFCFLYTDLANPTSNKIYMQIGYERVCDSAEYSFG